MDQSVDVVRALEKRQRQMQQCWKRMTWSLTMMIVMVAAAAAVVVVAFVPPFFAVVVVTESASVDLVPT
jgi:hypothetical protein